MTLTTKLGRAIKLCRTQRNMSQSDLAEAAQLSVSYLSLVERGKRDSTLSTIEAIANALGVPVFILVFLAASEEEIAALDSKLREKLSDAALQMIRS